MQTRHMLLVVACLSVAACATKPLVIDTSEGAELTYDGLSPVDNTRVDKAWARRDLDLAGYDKIMLVSAGIHYRPVKATTRSAALRSGKSEFPLTEEQKARVKEVFSTEFREELAKLENLEFVDEPGPDVLIVRAALLDVVSKVPPQPIGRSSIYLDVIGYATLVIEFIDSQSGTVLVRAVDLDAAQQQGIAFESNPVTNMAEVRRLAKQWAQLLRRSLEELSTNLGIGTG